MSDKQAPVAWAIESGEDGSLMGFCHTKRDATHFAHAIIEATKSERFLLRHVPLYRQPQPALTDAAIEVMDAAASYLEQQPDFQKKAWAATLWGVVRKHRDAK